MGELTGTEDSEIDEAEAAYLQSVRSSDNRSGSQRT
jgi:hypothetical protein